VLMFRRLLEIYISIYIPSMLAVGSSLFVAGNSFNQ
jgi:hypothetical protein